MKPTDKPVGGFWSSSQESAKELHSFTCDSANRGVMLGIRLVHSQGMVAARGRVYCSDAMVRIPAKMTRDKNLEGNSIGIRLVRGDT